VTPRRGPASEPTLLASGYGFLECPREDPSGGLYFADRSSVYFCGRDGTIRLILEQEVGGIAIHRDGGIVVSGSDISHFRDGVMRQLFRRDEIAEFNDIFTDRDGRVLCGSICPVASADWNQTIPRKTVPGDLWRINAQDSATRLYGNVGFSNGIGLSPDGRMLYHVDTFRREIIVHELTSDGGCERRARLSTASSPGYPDGLAVDEEGHIWVAMYEGGCVSRFSPAGQLNRVIDLPARNVTSLCFAGEDRRELVIVTCDNTERPELGACLYRVHLDVAGLAVPPASI
jgi:sugar lactone lactonase YvrE